MFGIGGWELLIIAVVALLVLGPKRLPAAARSIGRAASELRRATIDLRQSIENDPDLKELPKALDEINRPFYPNPYKQRPVPKDGPPEGTNLPPVELENPYKNRGGRKDIEIPGSQPEDAPPPAGTPAQGEACANEQMTKNPEEVTSGRSNPSEQGPPRREGEA